MANIPQEGRQGQSMQLLRNYDKDSWHLPGNQWWMGTVVRFLFNSHNYYTRGWSYHPLLRHKETKAPLRGWNPIIYIPECKTKRWRRVDLNSILPALWDSSLNLQVSGWGLISIELWHPWKIILALVNRGVSDRLLHNLALKKKISQIKYTKTLLVIPDNDFLKKFKFS